MSLVFEAWSAPGVGTFERKRVLDVVSGNFTDYRRQVGSGSATLPPGSDLSDLVFVDPDDHTQDVDSLIRVYKPAADGYPKTLVAEWMLRETPNTTTEGPLTVGGMAIESVLDWAVIYPKDWDGTWPWASTVADWIYGGPNLLPPLALGDLGSIRSQYELYLSGEAYELDLTNATAGDFTLTAEGDTTSVIAWDASHSAIKSALEATSGVSNVSVVQDDPNVALFLVVFESPKDLSSDATANFAGLTGSGSWTKQNDGFNTGTNPTFTIEVGGSETTNALPWNAAASTVEGSPLSSNGLEGLPSVDDVTVSGSGIAADPWIITFYAPPDAQITAVTFVGTDVLTQTATGQPDPYPVTLSMSVDATIDPDIHGTYGDPAIEVVTTPLDGSASWSLQVNATGRFAGSQIVLSGLTPGQTYQASIRVRPTVTGDLRLRVRDEFENFIAGTAETTITAGTWATLSIEDMVIPDGVTTVIMRVAVVDTDPAAWADFFVNWEGAEFTVGEPPANVGTILDELLDHIQTTFGSSRPGLPFINRSFTGTQDTAAVAWPEELRVNIQRGLTLRQVLERVFGPRGYEWNLTPTTGTPGEWDLNVWAPNNRGSLLDESVIVGQNTVRGNDRRIVPRASVSVVEGAAQTFDQAEDADAIASLGWREAYAGDVTFQPGDLSAWAAENLSRFLDDGFAPSFDLADGPDWPSPFTHYTIADRVAVTIRGRTVTRPVEVVGFTDTDVEGTTWAVQFGTPTFTGPGTRNVDGGGRGQLVVSALSGVAEGVRQYLDERRRLPIEGSAVVPVVPSIGGGQFTVTFAASDASDLSKSKADYLCTGTSDTKFISDTIANLPAPLLVVLSEGTFYDNPSDPGWTNGTDSFGILLDANHVSLTGQGPWITTIQHQGGLGWDTNHYTVGHEWCEGHVTDLSILGPYDLSSGGDGYSGVWMGCAFRQIVDNVHVEGASGNGIAWTAGAEEFWVTNCSVTYGQNSLDWAAFRGYGGTEAVHIDNNTVMGSSGHGIVISNAGSQSVNYSTMTNNIVQDVQGHGIAFAVESFGPWGWQISGNNLESTGRASGSSYGIGGYLGVASTRPGAASVASGTQRVYAAIYVEFPYAVELSNNLSSNAFGYGIYINLLSETTSDEIFQVEGNHMMRCAAGGFVFDTFAAVDADVGFMNWTLVGNKFKGARACFVGPGARFGHIAANQFELSGLVVVGMGDDYPASHHITSNTFVGQEFEVFEYLTAASRSVLYVGACRSGEIDGNSFTGEEPNGNTGTGSLIRIDNGTVDMLVTSNKHNPRYEPAFRPPTNGIEATASAGVNRVVGNDMTGCTDSILDTSGVQVLTFPAGGDGANW